MKKTTVTVLTALFLALALFFVPVSVSAEEGTCGDNLTWTYADGVLTISGSGAMYDFSQGGAPWEAYRDTISTVVLSGDVTTIGAYAFMDYDSIGHVDFGTSLVEVGTRAFMYCDGLTEITLPGSFQAFGEESFRSCSNLHTIHITGGFPSFRMSCLWDDTLTLYYPAGYEWDVDDIAWLEDIFDMEFIREDGYDPHDPDAVAETAAKATVPATQATAEATTESTTAPTAAPTTEPITVPTTQPTTAPTAQTIVSSSPAAQSGSVGTGSGSQSTAAGENADRASGSTGGTVALVIAILFGCCAVILYILKKREDARRRARQNRRSRR